MDFEVETFLVETAHAFDARQSDVIQYGDITGPLDTDGHTIGIAHALRGEGFDASKDGTGRGTPIVPVKIAPRFTCQSCGSGFGVDDYPRNPTCPRCGSMQCRDVFEGVAYTLEARENVQAVAFPERLSGTQYASSGDVSPSLQALNPTAVAYAIQERAVSENPDAGPDGMGVREHVAYTLEARENVQAVAYDLRGREGGAQFEGPHETANLRAASGGSSRSYIMQQGSSYAGAPETDAFAALLALRNSIGAEAFAEWGSGISDSLQSPEVLRPEVHGGGVRCKADEAGRGLGDRALSRKARGAAGAMRGLRQAGRERRPPQGRGLPEQLARELGEALSRLSSEGAQIGAFLRDLRRAHEGAGALQPALHPVQGRQAWAVRRLTPTECERLMGFPDGHTAIPWRGKPADQCPDGPRYKALGNSMAVPCMQWIGRRLDAELKKAKP
jgi:hypothetical protein